MSISNRRTIQIAITGLVLTALFAYGMFQARDLLKGPEIAISAPLNGATVHSSLVQIAGTTSRTSSIELNDRAISINKDGQFREPVTLSPGYNIITLEAADRFGRSIEHEVKIVHRPIEKDEDSLSQSEREAVGADS